MQCPNCGATVSEASDRCGSCGADARFTVRSPDGTAYGPYRLADIRQYANEGRIHPAAMLEGAAGWRLNLAQAGVTAGPPMTVAPAAMPRTGGGTSCLLIGVVGLVVLVPIMAILAAILFPVFARARDKARQASCLANLKCISQGVLQYAQDHDMQLPDAATWQQDTLPYVGNAQIYQCPSSGRGQQSYAFNPALSKVKLSAIQQPADTPMIYDAGLASGSGPHNAGGDVGYVDGHVKWVTASSFRAQGP